MRALLKFEDKEDCKYVNNQLKTISNKNAKYKFAYVPQLKVIAWKDTDKNRIISFSKWIWKRFSQNILEKPELIMGNESSSIKMILKLHNTSNVGSE